MSHSFFILAAYGVAGLGLLVLTVLLWIDYRGQQRAMAELEARGLRRRSDRRGA